MKTHNLEVSSSKSKPRKTSSTLDSAIGAPSSSRRPHGSKSLAHCASIAVLVIGVETLPSKLGLSAGACAAILIVPVVLAFVFHTIPLFREKRRLRCLGLIRGAGKPGYSSWHPEGGREILSTKTSCMTDDEDVRAYIRHPAGVIDFPDGFSRRSRYSVLSRR